MTSRREVKHLEYEKQEIGELSSGAVLSAIKKKPLKMFGADISIAIKCLFHRDSRLGLFSITFSPDYKINTYYF